MVSPVLPIDEIVGDLLSTLAATKRAVLVAPPGTGKTTRLPLLLAGLATAGGVTPPAQPGRILITEPRRAAARSAALRMASTLGERVGQRIGLRMRDDTRVSAHTIIEVVTEGVYLRMISADPSLEGISMVLFDETHERSLDSDVSMALSRYSHDLLRPDLQLVAMSATLDISATEALLDAPSVIAEAPLFPVTASYAPVLRANLVPRAAEEIATTLTNSTGDVLVFLPGAAEIGAVSRRLERSLANHGEAVVICPLTGSSTSEATDIALRPDPGGRRKVILATAVAQTSLTIPGVRVVVDCCLRRRSRFDPASGLSRLVTERSSIATAVQRAGRAGREAPGHVHRLLSETEFDRLESFDPPEIVDADLAEVALLLATWGIRSPNELRWITPPPDEHWDAAIRTLVALGALDNEHAITPLGSELADLPVHPRIGAMLHFVRTNGDADSHARVARFAATVAGLGPEASTARFTSFLGVATDSAADTRTSRLSDGFLGALAYPDRIAARTGDDPARYMLTSGVAATMKPDDSMRGTSIIVAIELDGDRKSGRIFNSIELTRTDLATLGDLLPSLRPILHRHASLTATQRVEVRIEHMIGHAIVRTERAEPTSRDIASAVRASINLTELLASESAAGLLARVAFARQFDNELPDWSVSTLTSDQAFTEIWEPAFAFLPPSSPLAAFDVASTLAATLTWEQRKSLDSLAPESVQLRERAARVDYTNAGGPTVAARLQDFLGMTTGPTIGPAIGHRIAVRIELLSPAQRPAAITTDLESFWKTGYPGVRTDLRGRYPKHDWPEDPLNWTPKPRTEKK